MLDDAHDSRWRVSDIVADNWGVSGVSAAVSVPTLHSFFPQSCSYMPIGRKRRYISDFISSILKTNLI